VVRRKVCRAVKRRGTDRGGIRSSLPRPGTAVTEGVGNRDSWSGQFSGALLPARGERWMCVSRRVLG